MRGVQLRACGRVRTAGALDLQHALFSSVMLECADERGSDGEDGPLAVRGRAGLGAGWRRSVDDVLVAPCDVGAVAGGVERGHGAVWVWRGSGGRGSLGWRARQAERSKLRLSSSTKRDGQVNARVQRMCRGCSLEHGP